MMHISTLKESFTITQRAELRELVRDFLDEVDAMIPDGLQDVFPGYSELCSLVDDLDKLHQDDYPELYDTDLFGDV